MFLQDLGYALLRRWYLVIVGLAITFVSVLGVQQIIPVSYKAQASVVLVPPQTAVVEGENPYLYMGALDQALSVLIVKMNSPQVEEQILRDVPDLAFSLSKDVTTTGPIILIESEGPTERQALDVVGDLLQQLPPNLVQIQDALGVPPDARIAAMTIVQDEKAEELTKKQLRMMIAVAGAGLAATLLATGWIDQLLTTFKARRRERKQDDGPEGSGTSANATSDGSSRSASATDEQESIDGSGTQEPAPAGREHSRGARQNTLIES